jgi:hypothetical protein
MELLPRLSEDSADSNGHGWATAHHERVLFMGGRVLGDESR